MLPDIPGPTLDGGPRSPVRGYRYIRQQAMDELAPLGAADDFDRLSAALRADSRDLGSFMAVIASKFESALPGRARVERARGLLGRGRKVTRVSLTLGELRFDLQEPGGRLEARMTRVVRGIALKSDELGIEAWLDQLARALGTEARSSSDARSALQRLLD